MQRQLCWSTVSRGASDESLCALTEGAGDFRACFSATPSATHTPEELAAPEPVEVVDPETGAVTHVTPEIPPEVAAARAAAEAQAQTKTRLCARPAAPGPWGQASLTLLFSAAAAAAGQARGVAVGRGRQRLGQRGEEGPPVGAVRCAS